MATSYQFDQLHQLLGPVLAEAAAGNTNLNLAPQPDQSPEFNELVLGVQALLETIRRQHKHTERLEVQMQELRHQTTEILARVLDRSVGEPTVASSRSS